jgi:hypothetical protein
MGKSAAQPAGSNERDVRPARDVIDHAIQENPGWEWVCFSLVILFPCVGVGVIIYGAFWAENGFVTLAGAVGAFLFWPALRSALEIRKTNIAIRLLEIPLSNSKSAKEAAEVIQQAFLASFVKEKKNVVSETKTNT